MHLNVEIKARCDDQTEKRVRKILSERKADFIALEPQVDTYFKVSRGRLKLREGHTEHNLIFYERDDNGGPKESEVTLFENPPRSELKDMLVKSLGVLVVVEKLRAIFFIENVKFHIDLVRDLGRFVEIEAIDKDGSIGKEKLKKQCREYIDLFGISEEDLIEKSYSDLIMDNATPLC